MRVCCARSQVCSTEITDAALADAIGRLIDILLTGGEAHDCLVAERLICRVKPPDRKLGDKAYDSAELREGLGSAQNKAGHSHPLQQETPWISGSLLRRAHTGLSREHSPFVHPGNRPAEIRCLLMLVMICSESLRCRSSIVRDVMRLILRTRPFNRNSKASRPSPRTPTTTPLSSMGRASGASTASRDRKCPPRNGAGSCRSRNFTVATRRRSMRRKPRLPGRTRPLSRLNRRPTVSDGADRWRTPSASDRSGCSGGA